MDARPIRSIVLMRPIAMIDESRPSLLTRLVVRLRWPAAAVAAFLAIIIFASGWFTAECLVNSDIPLLPHRVSASIWGGVLQLRTSNDLWWPDVSHIMCERQDSPILWYWCYLEQRGAESYFPLWIAAAPCAFVAAVGFRDARRAPWAVKRTSPPARVQRSALKTTVVRLRWPAVAAVLGLAVLMAVGARWGLSFSSTIPWTDATVRAAAGNGALTLGCYSTHVPSWNMWLSLPSSANLPHFTTWTWFPFLWSGVPPMNFSVGIPLWLPALPLTALAWIGFRLKRNDPKAGQCAACGHPLMGAETCPECGCTGPAHG
ncbi:MAG: hypothetical protein U0636_04500 [Phycisphaerales bacterium]